MKKIDHIGIATNNLINLKEEYISEGYKCINEVYDDIQKANLCLLKKDGNCVELIFTDEVESSVYKLCKDNYKQEYHTCYVVDSLKDEIQKLQKEGFILFRDICYAKLLNANVCFLYSKDKKIVELVEYYE